MGFDEETWGAQGAAMVPAPLYWRGQGFDGSFYDFPPLPPPGLQCASTRAPLAGPEGAASVDLGPAPLVRGKKTRSRRGYVGAQKRPSRRAVPQEGKVDWTGPIAIPPGKRSKSAYLCVLFPNAKRMRVTPAGPNTWIIHLI